MQWDLGMSRVRLGLANVKRGSEGRSVDESELKGNSQWEEQEGVECAVKGL